MKAILLFFGIILSASAFSQTSENPYDHQYESSDGLRRVESKGKFGYIDEKGNEIIPLQYGAAGDFSDGLAKVSFDKKKYGYINTKGAVVVALEYDEFLYGFSKGHTPAKKNGKWGMINEKGRLLIPHEYDYLYYFFNGFALAGKKVSDSLRYGYVNAQGKLVIPFRYKAADVFLDGLAAVKDQGKYGFINEKGETVIPFQYEDARGFSEGFAAVQLNGKWGFINKSGNTVISAQYDAAYSFSNGEAEVKKGGEGFFINQQGQRLNDGKWLMIFTKGFNLNDQFWYRGEKWDDEIKKKSDQGYRITDVSWNRFKPELFITMSKTWSYWQGPFSHGYDFDEMWKKVVENYKDRRSVSMLSYNNGKWTFVLSQLGEDRQESAIHDKYFPWESIQKHWKNGKFITEMAYGDRWMVVMRDEKYAHQLVKVYENDKWDQADVDAQLKKGYAITNVVKNGSDYIIVFTKGSGIKDQLLVWGEELPLRDIKGYWNKGWQSFRTIYIPRNITIDKSIFDYLNN